MRRLLLLAALADDLHDDNANLWLNYVGDHPLGRGPWGIHLESQFRIADWDGWQQILLRPGVNYAITTNLTGAQPHRGRVAAQQVALRPLAPLHREERS